MCICDNKLWDVVTLYCKTDSLHCVLISDLLSQQKEGSNKFDLIAWINWFFFVWFCFELLKFKLQICDLFFSLQPINLQT